MATTPYALVGDLGAYLGQEPPADSQRLLARATDLLDSQLVGTTYDVDVNGQPTLAAVIQAFRDATCAQVEYWIQNADEFGEGHNMQGFSIEGASVQFRTPPARLAPRAKDILRVAGLLPSLTPIHMP